MAKVSIGLRGWRFEESEIFTEDGDFKPLDQIPREVRNRLARIPVLMDMPCHACYAIHGDADIDRCTVPSVVWGEPMGEVVLCTAHEPDFHYWFTEKGGRDFAGSESLREAFVAWFEAGNRAPPDHEGMEYVDTDPEAVPRPPVPEPDAMDRPDVAAGRSIDLRDFAPSTEYPKRDP